jgi:thioredoxin-related protein
MIGAWQSLASQNASGIGGRLTGCQGANAHWQAGSIASIERTWRKSNSRGDTRQVARGHQLHEALCSECHEDMGRYQDKDVKTFLERRSETHCGGKWGRRYTHSRWFFLYLIVAFTHFADLALGADVPMDDSKLLTASYPDWFLETFLNLQDDLNNARESGKKGLMVVFSTVGCSYCYKFADETLRDPDVVAKLRRDFDALALEIFSDDFMIAPWGEELPVKEFARELAADYTPATYFFDLEGKPRLRIVGFNPPDRFLSAMRYVAEGHYHEGSFREFLAAERKMLGDSATTVKVEDSLFIDPPFMLARNTVSAHQPLMVVFDGPDCNECAYLFGTLFKDPRIRQQLLRMDVVRLRVDEAKPVVTPAGDRTTASDWLADLGFHRTPALAFFDQSGKLVLQSDALMLRQRLENTLGYVLERAYEDGISYQRFARRRSIARMQEERP